MPGRVGLALNCNVLCPRDDVGLGGGLLDDLVCYVPPVMLRGE